MSTIIYLGARKSALRWFRLVLLAAVGRRNHVPDNGIVVPAQSLLILLQLLDSATGLSSDH
jgi:hypothetical protein